MSDLRKLAASVLSKQDETLDETAMKQAKQSPDVFQGGEIVPIPVKHDSARKTGKNGPCFNVSFSRGGTNETWPRLRALPCPRGYDPQWWRLAIRDGETLVNDGWADTAKAYGWSDVELFGVDLEDPFADGLAVWLQGRKLRAILPDVDGKPGPAVAVDAAGNRFYFNRPRTLDATLLWHEGQHGKR